VARSLIPDPLTRRHLLEQKLDAAQAGRIGEAYLAAGRAVEALAFLKAADATDRLAAIRDEAIAAGDAFLLRETAKAMAQSAAADEWRVLADNATAAEKVLYADQARRQLGREG